MGEYGKRLGLSLAKDEGNVAFLLFSAFKVTLCLRDLQSGAKIRDLCPKLVDTFITKHGQYKGQLPKETRQKRSLILAPDCEN